MLRLPFEDTVGVWGTIKQPWMRLELKLDLAPVVESLLTAVTRNLKPLLTQALGEKASLVELSTIISYPGADMQHVHCDTEHGDVVGESFARCLTLLLAL